MDSSKCSGATRMAALCRVIFSLLILFSAEMFLLYHIQGPKIQFQPCFWSIVTMLHRAITVHPDTFNPLNKNFRLLLADMTLGLAEAGAFIHQAATTRWSIQDSILLYQSFFAVITATLIITYACISIGYRRWSNINYDVHRKDIAQILLFPGESRFLALLRTQATACLIFFIVSFALTNVLVDPLRESDLLPVKETRSLFFPTNLWLDSCQENSRYSCKPPTFLNILVAQPGILTIGDDKNVELYPAVSVATFNDGTQNSSASSCNLVRQPTQQVQGNQVDVNVTWNVLSFGCTYSEIPPQILITVNFTQLNIDSNPSVDLPFVHVMMGNTNDTTEIIRMTDNPVVILSGENLVGVAKQHILQHLKSQVSATLGMSNTYNTVVLSELVQVRSDPQVSRSPLILPSPDISTFRIIPFINIGDWKVMQEYRDKTSLKGLSSLGGLWTLFANSFILFFGISVMRSLFRTKPLAIFGLIHFLQPSFLERNTWSEKYQIGTKKPRNVQDFVDFMIDHIIDVDFATTAVQATNQVVEGVARDEEQNIVEQTDTL